MNINSCSQNALVIAGRFPYTQEHQKSRGEIFHLTPRDLHPR